MIVKVYGQFWNRNRVDWTAREALGTMKGKRRCDIWDQRGIYALYKDFRLVYVGQADNRGMGVRLGEHCKDRFAERWDSFSFFGICELDRFGNAKPRQTVTITPTSLIRSLELIGIILSDPPLNRARGRFPEAEKVRQIESHAVPGSKSDLREAISEAAAQLEKLRRLI